MFGILKTHRTTRICLVPILALVLLNYAATPAECAYVTVPNANAAVEGNSRNVIPFFANTSIFKYQQIHDSTQFGDMGPSWITQIAFRPDVSTPILSPTELRLEIDLATTSVNSTNTDSSLAANRGPDASTVFVGSLTFPSIDNGPAEGPKGFDAVIDLDTPFLYDPGAGNLLMEIRRPPPVPPVVGLTYLDAVFQSSGISRIWEWDHTPDVGQPYPGQGLVTRFTFVPEPASLLLVVCAVGVLPIRQQFRSWWNA